VIHCTKPQLPGFHRAERYAEKVPAVRAPASARLLPTCC